MVALAPDGLSVQVYLTPDANSAQNDSIILYGYKQEDVYTGITDAIAFPREWGEAIVYGLTVRLAPEYGTPLDYKHDLQRDAEMALFDAVNWNPEATSFYFGESTYGRS
jgi:hypothetical protein